QKDCASDADRLSPDSVFFHDKESVMSARCLLAVCVSFVYVLPRAGAGEWPQFRGPHSDGVVAETSLPTEWDAAKNVQWKAKIPGVAWSSPVVWGDKVFVTTAITDNQRKPPADGGFGGFGPGGPGGPGGGAGGFGGRPRSGQILPPFLQGMLNLTAEQKKT